MVNKCKEMEQEYTGNTCKSNLNIPYLVSNLDELNLLADAMENRLGLRYTTHLVDCYRHQNGFDAVCKSTVNLALLRLRPKIIIIQKIQQGTNDESKWK